MKITLTDNRGATVAEVQIDEAVILEDPLRWSCLRVTLATAVTEKRANGNIRLHPWLRPAVVTQFRAALRQVADDQMKSYRKSVKRALRIVSHYAVDRDSESKLLHTLNEIDAEINRRSYPRLSKVR